MHQKQSADSAEVLFLMSPNFGLLDNWLPVLWELKKRQPETKIIALLPKVQTVLEIDPADVTIQLGESVIDKVIFRSRAGFWVVAENLTHAKKLAKQHHAFNLIVGKMRTALRLYGTLVLLRPAVALFEKIFAFIVPALTNEKHVMLKRIGTNIKAICFDVYAKTKKDCEDVFECFPHTPRFSILHGLAVNDAEIKDGNAGITQRTYRTMVYLFSKHEVLAYRGNYGLKNSELKVVGVPRHNPDWIHTVVHNTKNDIPPSWEKYIFVISRPIVKGFFPREKKRKALEDIRKLAFEDLHVKVVVRFHPTERKVHEGIYEEVFGKESCGKSWMYSFSHPFVIGKRSLFAITFYSGVVIDMLALRIPSIQITDFVGGGKMGTIMDYKKMGLALGADNYEELKQHAFRIIEKKDAVMRQLMPNYDEYFRPVGNSVRTITDDIVKAL